MAKVESREFTTPKTILVAPELAFTLSIKVTNTGVSADDKGRKILYAGQPISGDLTARQTAFVKANGANANAVLLHTVDVTDGVENATAVVFGFIDESKLDNVEVSAEEKAALTKITFVK